MDLFIRINRWLFILRFILDFFLFLFLTFWFKRFRFFLHYCNNKRKWSIFRLIYLKKSVWMFPYFFTSWAIVEISTNRTFVSGSNQWMHTATITLNSLMNFLRVIRLNTLDNVFDFFKSILGLPFKLLMNNLSHAFNDCFRWTGTIISFHLFKFVNQRWRFTLCL